MKRAAAIAAEARKRLKAKDEKRKEAWEAFKADVWGSVECAGSGCCATPEAQHHVGPWKFWIADVKWFGKKEGRQVYCDEDLRPELLQTVPVCKSCHDRYHRTRKRRPTRITFEAPTSFAPAYEAWLAKYLAGAF